MANSLASIFSKILEVSEKSFYRWKSTNHKILISLLEEYFTKEELEEFINTKKIQKYDLVKNMNFNELELCIKTKMVDDIIRLRADNQQLEKDNVSLNIDVEKELEFIDNNRNPKDKAITDIYEKLSEIQKDIKKLNS